MTAKEFLKRISSFDGIALIDNDSDIDYEALVSKTFELSDELCKIGLSEDDVVCFSAEKNINSIIIFLALMNSGIACCPIHAEETNLPPHTVYIVRTNKNSNDTKFFLRNVCYKIIKRGDVPAELKKHFRGKYLNATSGSTGAKKYAIASWQNIYANAKYVCEEYRHDETLTYMSLFSANMHICESFMRALFCGGTAVLVENTEAEAIVRLVEEKKVNYIECVPSQLLAIKENFCKIDKPKKLIIECAGGLLSIKAEDVIQSLFPNATIVRSWGSAEGSGICLTTINSSVNEHNSLGKVVKGYEAIIDTSGQMLLKGEGVVSALFNSGQIVEFIDYYSTGDLVSSDEEGNFHILGRTSNMIKCAGENIYPTTIEDVLYRQGDVEECVVIGIPDDFRGEKVVAWITISSEKPLPTEHELKNFCQSYLVKNQLVPKNMYITYEMIPKNASGKINITKVKEFFIGGNHV